jgi:hypothetical protein
LGSQTKDEEEKGTHEKIKGLNYLFFSLTWTPSKEVQNSLSVLDLIYFFAFSIAYTLQ